MWVEIYKWCKVESIWSWIFIWRVKSWHKVAQRVLIVCLQIFQCSETTPYTEIQSLLMKFFMSYFWNQLFYILTCTLKRHLPSCDTSWVHCWVCSYTGHLRPSCTSDWKNVKISFMNHSLTTFTLTSAAFFSVVCLVSGHLWRMARPQ